jgi:hypothetical protein
MLEVLLIMSGTATSTMPAREARAWMGAASRTVLPLESQKVRPPRSTTSCWP